MKTKPVSYTDFSPVMPKPGMGNRVVEKRVYITATRVYYSLGVPKKITVPNLNNRPKKSNRPKKLITVQKNNRPKKW